MTPMQKAVEANARAEYELLRTEHAEDRGGFSDTYPPWEELHETAKAYYIRHSQVTTAAALASLEADGWPSEADVMAALTVIDKQDSELYYLTDLQSFARALLAGLTAAPKVE